MMHLAGRFHPHPEVVDTELEEQELVLLHLESMQYCSLDLAGMRIWRGLKRGLSLQEISRRLQAEFEAGPDRAERNVLALVSELCQQQLVQSPAWSPRTIDRADRSRCRWTAWQNVRARAKLFRSPLDRWRYPMCVLLVPSPTDHQLIRLPSALGVLYYPLRLLRLTVKYGRHSGAHGLRRLKDAHSHGRAIT